MEKIRDAEISFLDQNKLDNVKTSAYSMQQLRTPYRQKAVMFMHLLNKTIITTKFLKTSANFTWSILEYFVPHVLSEFKWIIKLVFPLKSSKTKFGGDPF